MKILYVTTISNTVNAFLIPHIQMLINQGHSVDIACNITRPIDEKLLELGCNVHNIEFQRSPFKRKNYIAYNYLKNIINQENYDLVHTHTPVASFLTRLACRKLNNTKVLYTAHGFHFYKGAPLINILLYYPLERVLARYTDAIITINEEDFISAKKFKLNMKDSVYKTHGVGIDLDKFSQGNSNEKVDLRKKYRYKNNDFILFYAAELNRNKHQDLLINAVNLLKSEIPNIKLLLAGTGSMKEQYEEEVKKLGLQEKVEFLGFRNDIAQLLKLSDVAVASSRREGLPVNLMEAMATGLPLVVTDCRGQRDLVTNEENGFVIDVLDYEAFAKAIKNLFIFKDLKEEYSKKNIEKAKDYSINHVLNEVRDIYSHIFAK
ncbi:glycosyltransferase family 4 protein [Fictibacillus sp. NRS-1165]|uniref:glycosyltransferase family 4 protein n=1 Tax=Fictibacillus sp. NRS-1165 TaxID=3144463 RepID=UPI003D190E79